MIEIVLPWPPSDLSGHQDGRFWRKAPIVANHRAWALAATKAAARGVPIPGDGDIRVIAGFYPPDRRTDRVNMPNRLKPYWDGIADGLGVNDRRFLPSYVFGEPSRDPRVVIVIEE